MSMKSLKSAAHAAGYAMVADDVSEARTQLVHGVPQSTAVVVTRPVRRGVVANAQRSLRRLWLRAWSADHWGNRAPA